MAQIIPFRPSLAAYRMTVPLDNATPYIFDVRWNAREGAWYFDMSEEDETPIVRGVKIVLGMYLGRRSTHPFFSAGCIMARDSSGAWREAGFDDITTRVEVARYRITEMRIRRGVFSLP